MARYRIAFLLIIMLAVLGQAAVGTVQADDPDLAPIKNYLVENTDLMKESTAALLLNIQRYYQLVEEAEFDYEAVWAEHPQEVAGILIASKELWLQSSFYYEMSEGLVAGVPSLSHYDVLLDAGASAEEDPEEALEWALTLPDGTVLESPGNYFHHLTEPALWGTEESYVGLEADLDGDGEIVIGEVLPEANILLGAIEGLDTTTAELQESVAEWEPTVEDAFTALVVMIPTMNEYFGQWKESVYIAGDESEVESFVAVSRLADIKGILNGLSLTYDILSPLVEAQNAELHTQIDTDFEGLVSYVDDLYTQELDGAEFSAEEADALGTEAQLQAETLVALVAQAADDLGLTLELE